MVNYGNPVLEDSTSHATAYHTYLPLAIMHSIVLSLKTGLLNYMLMCGFGSPVRTWLLGLHLYPLCKSSERSPVLSQLTVVPGVISNSRETGPYSTYLLNTQKMPGHYYLLSKYFWIMKD